MSSVPPPRTRFKFHNPPDRKVEFIVTTDVPMSEQDAFEKFKPWLNEHWHFLPSFTKAFYFRVTADGQLIRQDEPN
jgi:hypothetical protein